MGVRKRSGMGEKRSRGSVGEIIYKKYDVDYSTSAGKILTAMIDSKR